MYDPILLYYDTTGQNIKAGTVPDNLGHTSRETYNFFHFLKYEKVLTKQNLYVLL